MKSFAHGLSSLQSIAYVFSFPVWPWNRWGTKNHVCSTSCATSDKNAEPFHNHTFQCRSCQEIPVMNLLIYS